VSLSEVDINAGTGFLLAEEAALKRYVSRVVIPSPRKADRQVPVYFRYPTSERTIAYPYILLDLISIDPAYEMWHSEVNVLDDPAQFIDPVTGLIREGMYYPSTTPDVIPEGYEIGDPGLGRLERYLPYKLMFQVTTHAASPIDDRVLHARLLLDIFPPRSFFIGVEADHVWRRGELIQWVAADTQETTESGNRIFRKIYTVSMETEIPTSRLREIAAVRQIHVDIYDLASEQPLPPGHDTDAPEHVLLADTFTTVEPPSGP
jgi:hypothetical protein